jgi:hypothetical protein
MLDCAFVQTIDFFMADHTSMQRMEAFCARALSHEDFVATARHMVGCETCLETFREVSRRRRNYEPPSIDLSLENLFKDEHLGYERLVSYAEDRLDEIDREITAAHLRVCPECYGDVRDFLEYKRLVDPWLHEPDASATRHDFWKAWGWLAVIRKSALVGAIAAAAILALLAILLFRKIGIDNREDQRVAAHSPSPVASIGPSASPSQTVSSIVGTTAPEATPSPSDDLVAVLNDNDRQVLLDGSGRLTGLNGLSTDLRQSIEKALRDEALKRPPVMSDLNGVRDSLRGTDDKTRFRLLSPVRTVLAEDRPTFRWEPLKEATEYQVFIGEPKERHAMVSEKLPAGTTQWIPPTRLRRGLIYSWAVTATVNGEAITSPRPAEPEVKFKVLEEAKARELDGLKKEPSSHLALGVCYANAGMAEEAERELQTLARENPNSRVAASLLRAVRSWR